MRVRWFGIVVGSLWGASAYAQDGQALTRPSGVLVTSSVGPTSPARDRVADSVGVYLKRRLHPSTMLVATRADLLRVGRDIAGDYIVDIDIDDERAGPQLTTLIIERETNAQRRLERIPLSDPAVAVRTLVERLAADSIMTKRRGCQGDDKTQIRVGGC